MSSVPVGTRSAPTIGTGPLATGTPDFAQFDEASGKWTAGRWAAGLSDQERRFAIDNEADSPWVFVGGDLLPPSVARNQDALARRRQAVGAAVFNGPTRAGGGINLVWLLAAAALVLVGTQ